VAIFLALDAAKKYMALDGKSRIFTEQMEKLPRMALTKDSGVGHIVKKLEEW